MSTGITVVVIENTSHGANVDLILAHRLRCWPAIKNIGSLLPGHHLVYYYVLSYWKFVGLILFSTS